MAAFRRREAAAHRADCYKAKKDAETSARPRTNPFVTKEDEKRVSDLLRHQELPNQPVT
jgi:hypothetical protein